MKIRTIADDILDTIYSIGSVTKYDIARIFQIDEVTAEKILDIFEEHGILKTDFKINGEKLMDIRDDLKTIKEVVLEKEEHVVIV